MTARQDWRRWYSVHRPDRLLAMRDNWARRGRFYRYRISEEEWQRLLESQEHRCALCRRRKPLSVDHDHRLGGCREAVRGGTCVRCNSALARLFESRGLENFWTLAAEYEPLGCTREKAAILAAYLKIPATA